MGTMTTVTLDDHATQFLEEQVASGRFGSPSEALMAALKLMEIREAELAELRALIDAGDASGVSEGFDIRAFIAKKRAGMAA